MSAAISQPGLCRVGAHELLPAPSARGAGPGGADCANSHPRDASLRGIRVVAA